MTTKDIKKNIDKIPTNDMMVFLLKEKIARFQKEVCPHGYVIDKLNIEIIKLDNDKKTNIIYERDKIQKKYKNQFEKIIKKGS